MKKKYLKWLFWMVMIWIVASISVGSFNTLQWDYFNREALIMIWIMFTICYFLWYFLFY